MTNKCILRLIWGFRHMMINNIPLIDLNVLAAKFYEVLNYTTTGYHDFYASSHPMEKNMFVMALEAYAFNLRVGLD